MAFQNLDTNSLLRLETMFSGKPFSQYQLSKNKIAKSSAEMSVWVGTILTLAPKRSVMERIQLNPKSSLSGPMKSIAIDWPCSSRTGRGCNGPGGLVVGDLFHWQSAQDRMYAFSRSRHMLGQ